MTDEERAEEYVDILLRNEKWFFIIGKEKIKKYILKVCLDALECCKKFYNERFVEGFEEGYQKAMFHAYVDGLAEGGQKWHDLRKDPDDLPKCTENEQIIFYVHEYYTSIDKYINHYCLGFYKKSFVDDDVKLFVERSKGYECEHSTEEVFCWCELPKFEE